MDDPAPITRLLLTLQFKQVLASLTILDWAELRALFAEDFPVFGQVPRAGPMPTTLGDAVIELGTGWPRLSMSSADLSRTILIQDDRVSFGWNRVAPLTADPEYPGFTAILSDMLAILSAITDFLKERALEVLAIRTGEVYYADAFIIAMKEKQIRQMQDVFSCVNSIPDFKFGNVRLHYQLPIVAELDLGITGLSETVISGIFVDAEGLGVSLLETTVRFDVGDQTPEAISQNFKAAHDEASRLFSTLVKPEASAILELS